MKNTFTEITNFSTTANGAATLKSSTNPLLDLLFLAGAARTMSEEDISLVVDKALVYDEGSAIKLIFWSGDIREGAGERRFFTLALTRIKAHNPSRFEELIQYVPLFSRWDVLFNFEESIPYVAEVFRAKSDTLLFKWLPREKNKKFARFRNALLKHLGISNKEYRKTCASFSHSVEQDLSAKRFGDINYSHVPSIAFKKYTNTFNKHDSNRFRQFINDANAGKTKVNAGAIHPDRIIGYDVDDWDAAAAQWKNLPKYTLAGNTLAVCDVSGSMYGTPMDVSIGLGLYLSENLTGEWKDVVCTFSHEPTFLKLEGDLRDKHMQLREAPWGMNTNLIAVFSNILEFGLAKNIKPEDMPHKILVISDMEFDEAAHSYHHSFTTNFEAIDEMYANSPYEKPEIIFWNVQGRIGNVPVKSNEHGVKLVSGRSPAVLKFVLESGGNPMSVVQGILEDTRYSTV